MISIELIPTEQRIVKHQIPEVLLAAAAIEAAWITADLLGADHSTTARHAVTHAVNLLRECEMRVDDTLAEETDDDQAGDFPNTVGDSLGDYIDSIAEYVQKHRINYTDDQLGAVVALKEGAGAVLLEMIGKASAYARTAIVVESLDADDNAELRAAATEALGILNEQSPGHGPIQQTAYRLWRALGLDVKPDDDPDDDPERARGPVVDANLGVDTSEPRTALEAMAGTVEQFARFAGPTAESLLPPGPLLNCYTFDHVEHMIKTYAGKAPTARVFRLRLPYYWIAAGTLVLRDCVGEYFVTMPDAAHMAAQIKGDTPRLSAETVFSNPHIFEEIFGPVASSGRRPEHVIAVGFGDQTGKVREDVAAAMNAANVARDDQAQRDATLRNIIDPVSTIGSEGISARMLESLRRYDAAVRRDGVRPYPWPGIADNPYLRPDDHATIAAQAARDEIRQAERPISPPSYADQLREQYGVEGATAALVSRWPAETTIEGLLSKRSVSSVVFARDEALGAFVCYLNSTTMIRGGQAKWTHATVEGALLGAMVEAKFHTTASNMDSAGRPISYIVPGACAKEINAAAVEVYHRITEAATDIEQEGTGGAAEIARNLRAAGKRMREALRGLEVKI